VTDQAQDETVTQVEGEIKAGLVFGRRRERSEIKEGGG